MNPLREELLRCVRCGNCLSVCPVYRQLRREWSAARGRLTLLQAADKGQVSLDRRLRGVLTSCLLCGKCRSGCPNEVDTPALVKAARALLTDRGEAGGGAIRTLLRSLMPRRNFGAWLKLARALRPLWARGVPDESGLYLRFLRAQGEKIQVPKLASPFLDKYPLPALPPLEAPTERLVAVFPDCVERYVRPGAALSEIELLRRSGYAVYVPPGLGCCGLGAWSAGEVELARRLFRRNLELLLPATGPRPRYIVSNCSSCSYLFRHAGELFSGARGELAAQLGELSARSLSISRLPGLSLAKNTAAAGERKPLIAWHQPCHLEGEPHLAPALLKTLAGANFVELKTSGDCCGGGGIFSFLYPGLSERIGLAKRQEVLEKGVEFLVTECSGCVIALERLFSGVKVEVLTLSQAAERFG